VTPSRAYTILEDRFRRIGRLREIGGLLAWDQRVMMPDGASDLRAEHLAELDLVAQDILRADDIPDLLAEAGQSDGLDGWQRANLEAMRRLSRHARAVPPALLEARTKAAAVAEMAWRTARRDNRFGDFAGPLERMLAVTRDRAAALGAETGSAPYDALLDLFEPGASRATVAPLLADLAGFLTDRLPRILERQARQRAPLSPPAAATAAQASAGRELAALLGFDFTRGRLDETLHPFTGGASGDIRITTRYDPPDPLSGLLAVAHEAGHALYEAGLPEEWRSQPVGRARGMVLHESQSLLCERQVLRSPDFLARFSALLETSLGVHPAWSATNLAALTSRVEPGLIRVEADEVTYPLHILLRFELEQALLSGDLPVADLPAAWATGMRDLLGVTVPDDRRGCLQDIHWAVGHVGYFPTYTLGALAAVQLFEAARADLDAAGATAPDHAAVLAWMRDKVHRLASSAGTDEILLRATGAGLGTAAFRAHIDARYLS